MKHNYPYDDSLIPLLAAGDLQAYRVIYDHYFPIIYRFILKWVKPACRTGRDESFAKEIAQEVFVAVWGKRANYVTVEDLRTCLFTAAKNAVFDALKKLASR